MTLPISRISDKRNRHNTTTVKGWGWGRGAAWKAISSGRTRFRLEQEEQDDDQRRDGRPRGFLGDEQYIPLVSMERLRC